MDIRKKLALIAAISMLAAAIPASIAIYFYFESNILEREISGLIHHTRHYTSSVTREFEESEIKLQGLAKILDKSLAKPPPNNEIEQFQEMMELNTDGVWRNRKTLFDGQKEAGIFLPSDAQDLDAQKIIHLRIKQTIDSVGPMANLNQANIWYLSRVRGEVIFDRSFPDFVFLQKSDNDYTQTPWVTYTSPAINPERKFKLTPPLYDPVPKVWMVSSIYPLYIGDKWIGTLGQDIQLSKILAIFFQDENAYQGTQHYILDQQGNFILAGAWQGLLESTANSGNFKLPSDSILNTLLKTPVQAKPKLLNKSLVIDNRKYVAIGTSIGDIGWRYYTLTPVDQIMLPTRQLFFTLIAVIFFVSILSGLLISTAVNSFVVKRIRRLTDGMRLYESGMKVNLHSSLSGSDEISHAAREFDIMVDRIDQHIMDVELARDLLRSGEQKWRFALEGAGDGVWEFDFESKLSTISPRMMEILGRDPTSDGDSMSFSEMTEGIHPDSLAPSMAALQAVIDKQTDRYIVEQQVRHNNGSYIWLLSRGMVTSFSADGKPLHMIGTSSDITERKHTEQLLTTAHAKYQRLVENIGDEYNFFTMDAKGMITYVSPSISKMMGWTPEESLGHYSKTLTDSPINKQASVYTEAGLRGEKQPPYLIEDTHKDGRKRILEVNETPVFDENGKAIGLEGVAHDITERIKAENSLKAAHAKYEHLVENISDEYYFYSHNDQGYFTYVSTSVTKMLGWTPEEYLTHHTKFLTNHPVNKDCIRFTSAGLKGHKQPPYMVQRYHKDGSTRWLELTETPVKNEYGKVIGLEGIAHDITKRIEAESKLKLAASVFTHAREGIMITDAVGTIIEVNNTFTEITGYSRDEAIGQTPRILKSERHPPEFYKAMWEELKEKGYWSGEIWNHHKNGDEYVVSMTTSHVLSDAGDIQSYVALFTDITTMKAHQQQLEHVAHYDVLTNLPNRVLLADRLSQAMLNSQRLNQSVAVVFLDLDGFKIVNDEYGHKIGDDLLINLTERMKTTLRESDTLARIGGDEFVAVLTGLENPHDCEMLLARLLKVTSSPINIKGITLQVSASIGVTLYPQDGSDADLLMRHADQAMYIAKQAGKNRYHLFDIEQDIAIKSQRETIEHIAAALNNQGLCLVLPTQSQHENR